ncbi:DegT/DnrJ/EryC1/StrS family aminotransferase [Candidatus Nitrosocosmicus agrestis]|jgi:dTDP-4-amino-4,6-dideoxygalactose transaminase|uniref:DegT/DnrJ/EryC1/StrS family aminotransferase n=1 Tax=Candidatus Nitrosocosmicus agrestis TaxID=2563600 RepID=UPI00122E960B|nr:DegT/DnrJ/EryC1/StrS family aminotransferase [Candidatus Nitrosocosmicus sp. SS]KAA2282451.1 DegT/DnrJ/EryC1/StrS family aminotransferase [Candidatus Nitrosocosmicus sp. SS]KAF0868717.1 DegT/DnrJ/EryC1/StrS family aminotransferase [Candidatus Nitrosocosmicus sp. SS]MDR4489700.1 DegT/DnrJ/EryC1/StrS family aminotransferase [Candidatus Nitrosocosmicus sp.]
MIPINKPWLDEDAKQEVLNVLSENSLTSPAKNGGKRVQDFESLLKSYLNVKHVIAVNSGTSAIHAALLSIGIKPGDEVILPSFTFVATANSVIATGAKPVFADVNKNDFTIDINDIKKKVNEKTKAIIPVHLYGHPSDMDEIIDIASSRSLSVIEDACQSLGSLYNQKQTGTIGHLGCFSFYASKVLTTGEGGAIVTNNDDLHEQLLMIRNHGMVNGYDTRVFGLNLRLPELSAALGISQMKKLNQMLGMRKSNAKFLFDGLKKFEQDGLLALPQEAANKKFNWYLFTIAFKENSRRDLIKNGLVKEGIGATIYYDPPIHKTPFYENNAAEYVAPSLLSNTEWAWSHVLSLPVHPLISEDDLSRILKVFENILK